MRWNLFRSRRISQPHRVHRLAPSCRPTLEALEDRRLPATFTWVLNGSGDFNTAANWRDQNNNPGVPGPADDAMVPMTSTAITITSSTSNTVNSLIVNADATLTIAGGTFTVEDVGKNSFLNSLTLDAGTTLQANAGNQANSGTLFVGGGSGAGTFVSNSGATINFTNNPHQFDVNTGTSFTGAGKYLIAGGLVSINTSVNAPSSFEMDSGTLEGSGTLTITNTFAWQGGSLDGNGTTVVPVGTTLTISGNQFNKAVTGGHTLNIAGTATWTGTAELDGSAGSTINNSGTFNVENDAVSGGGGAAAGLVFNNSGTFTKSGTTGTTSFQGNLFNNSGSVNVQSGTLSFTNNYTQTGGSTVVATGATLASSGTVNIGAGSTLSGTGTVSGNVSNAGIISTGSSTGTLTITGALTQTATGVVNVKIASPTQFDTIAVGGAATLAGTLNISLVNNFVPSASQSYKVLTFGSSSGAFATITGTSIPNSNLVFNPVLDPTDFTLQVGAPNTTTIISGTVFQDINTNGVQDPGEPGIAGQTVFLDLDGSGTLKAGDPTTTTDANGNFQFTISSPGTYIIRTVLFGGVLVGVPASGSYQVTVTNGVNLGEENFAEVPTSIAVPLTLPPSTAFQKQGNANGDYVEGLYRSILNRDADAGGLANWTSQLISGKLSRLQVVQGIRLSPEHFTQEVTDFYMTILGRAPDSQGLQGWVQNLQNGLPEEQIAFDFLDSPEYLSKGDKFFVDQMYQAVLGRPFDTAGEANWLNVLGDDATGNATHAPTLTHEQVITSFLDSQESLTRLVEGFYQVYLQRLADAGGLSNWLSALQQGGSFLAIGQQFLSSDEFYNRAAAEG